MFERMLDKRRAPTLSEIRAYIGETAYTRLCGLEDALAARYDLTKELRFPFGSHYGWGFKFSHRAFHLCYAFFEQGAFTVMLQLGDKQVPAVERLLPGLTPKARALWAGRYPCGENGGWIQYRILEDTDLDDALRLIPLKKAPRK